MTGGYKLYISQAHADNWIKEHGCLPDCVEVAKIPDAPMTMTKYGTIDD